MSHAAKRFLPGDTRSTMAGALRVDHAGEYGATRIYAGQLAVLKHDACAPELRHMLAQEEVHLARFNQLLPEHAVRPTALLPAWHVLGWMMGAGSALLGSKAAMACTVAVEEVIAEHYQDQLNLGLLPNEQVNETVRKFRDEELEHHDSGLAHGAKDSFFYAPLKTLIGAACRTAIRVSSLI